MGSEHGRDAQASFRQPQLSLKCSYAEICRVRLTQLALTSGDEVWVVFRHIRLFPEGGKLVERDFAA